MTIALFFPNYLGGGFGHIGRCLALADSWVQRGGEAVFAINGPHLTRVANSGYKCCVINTPAVHKPSQHAPAYLYISGMAYQIVRDGFDHPGVVERALKEAQKIVDQIHPDVLVGDGWPLTGLLGRQAKLPVVQLVKSVAHPKPEPLIGWEAPPEKFFPPDPAPVFNPVLKRLGMPTLKYAEELLCGDLLLLPSIPALDPMPALPADTYYIGPITRNSTTPDTPPAWFSTIDGNKPVVYITIGGAAGSGMPEIFFRLISEALGNTDYKKIVSTGGQDAPINLGELPANIHWERWVPTRFMLERSNTVVFHGGYTRMEILEKGLPSIVIPFHSEQEYYGRNMAKAGVSICLSYSDAPYFYMQARWRAGKYFKRTKYSIHARLNPTLTPPSLRDAVERTLTDPTMYLKARALQAELKTYRGSEHAVELIESHT